jgi:hypothetical protein
MNPSDCPVVENNIVPAGGEDADLRIESTDGRAVRFALLSDLKPVLLLCLTAIRSLKNELNFQY